jgi:hypothetical protein
MSTKKNEKKSTLGTRVCSLAALCAVVGAIGCVGNTVYRVSTDGFVAPIILSPDSDMVIQSKLSLAQLVGEQMQVITKKEAIDVEIAAADKAIEQLESLHASASKALEWTTALSAQQASAGSRDFSALDQQRAVLTSMLGDEQRFLERMKKEMDAGLVAKTDYARELQSLKQMQIAALENERAHIVTGAQMSQVRLTQRAIKAGGGKVAIATPEMLMQQDQLVRVRCEIIRLESERRVKLGERRHLDDELAKIEELLAQLKKRPIFRAIEANTNVAFVPYTQMNGVKSGAPIYECVWGVFACKSVGTVTELLPGEAIVQDPWGSPARGQYAIMSLDDAQAAQAKTLRVRPSSTAFATLSASASDAVTRMTPSAFAAK